MANINTNSLEAAFSGLSQAAAPVAPQVAPVAPVVGGKVSKSEANKNAISEEQKMLNNNLKTVITTDATYQQEHGTLSEFISVVNTLGFGKGGDRIHDKEASANKLADLKAQGLVNPDGTFKLGPDGKKVSARVLTEVPRIVGYVIQNNSQVTVNYKTTQCTPKADGTGYDVVEVDAVLAPGAQAMVDKQHMIMLTAMPQIAFQLANGSMKKAPNQLLVGSDPKDLADKFYFAFDKESGIQVHDASVKKMISAEEADGTHKVLPEYASVFGYLENVKEVARKSRAAGEKSPYNSKDAQAEYVRQLLNGTNTF